MEDRRESNAEAMKDAEFSAKFQALCLAPPEEQATQFLRAFVTDFVGKFEDVLLLADDFKKMLEESGNPAHNELEKDKIHQYLEMHDEALHNAELVEAMKSIDITMNNKTAFIEYLMWKYDKRVPDLFVKKTDEEALRNKELLTQLDVAIAAYKTAGLAFSEHEKKIKELEALVEAGGVKGMKAKHELAQLKERRFTVDNKARIEAGARTKRLEKDIEKDKANAAAEAERIKAEEEARQQAAWAEENKRLEAEKAARDAEEAKKKEESKQRLKAKAALWEGNN